MTRRDSKRAIFTFNNGVDLRELSRKTNLYKNFASFMGWTQLATSKMTINDFVSFCDNNSHFLFKPDIGASGHGIKKYDVTSFDSLDEMFETLRKDTGILDPIVYQHEDMEQLHKDSVNTIRLFTLRDSNSSTTILIAAALRMGRDGSFVDNHSAGGILAPVDVNSGVAFASAEDFYGRRYAFHPDSNTKIVGFKIPNWKKVLKMVNEASQIATVPYVGWDVAIRTNDCILIEANYKPMVNVIQTADGGGKKSLYKKLIRENT